MLWTSLNTGTTGNTFILINNGYTVYNMKCIEVTSLNTVTVAKTAISTSLCTTVNTIFVYTVRCTIVFKLVLSLVTSTITFYKGCFLSRSISLNTHNFADCSSSFCTTNRTAIYRSFTSSNSFG